MVSMATEAVASTLGAFAASLSYEEIPGPILHRLKTCVLDVIGNAAGGICRPNPARLAHALVQQAGVGSIPVWGTHLTAPPAVAAMVNAALVCGADFSYGPVAEIGAGLIPPVVAAGEQIGADGRDVLVALTVAHECIFRVIYATVSQRIQELGFYHSGIQCPPAAAAGVASTLGLSAEEASWAIGLAAASGTGTMAMFNEGAGSSKYIFVGRAAETALHMAALAREGYRCDARIFEEFYLPVYGSGAEDAEKLTVGLGEDFLTRYVRFKLVPACLHSHTPVESAVRLAERGIQPDDVEEIQVRISTMAEELVGDWREVRGIVDAQYSAPFLISFVLHTRRRPKVHEFTPELLADPSLRTLAARVHVTADPAFDEIEGYGAVPPFANPCQLRAHLKSGETVEVRVERPKGTYPDLPPDEEIFAKFEDQASLIYQPGTVQSILETVMALEELDAISTLTAKLVPDRF
ncbi:MAG: MmgE/PrpD family protein [Ardenticatenaceae bacterium]|nr:MmgE/PrpD family protein [Ardenticatenaceae bacterium]